MENNVKDWLPDSFTETQELAWFARHFVGEQAFVLLTWEGCSEQDRSYRLLVEKLRPRLPWRTRSWRVASWRRAR